MRNISFSLTTPQFHEKSKDVTRRLGWGNLKAGDRLMACEKCQGIKRGEKVVRLGEIIVVCVRIEALHRMILEPEYGQLEASREGFPDLTGAEFVTMFCKHMNCLRSQLVTRIEFAHAPEQ